MGQTPSGERKDPTPDKGPDPGGVGGRVVGRVPGRRTGVFQTDRQREKRSWESRRNAAEKEVPRLERGSRISLISRRLAPLVPGSPSPALSAPGRRTRKQTEPLCRGRGSRILSGDPGGRGACRLRDPRPAPPAAWPGPGPARPGLARSATRAPAAAGGGPRSRGEDDNKALLLGELSPTNLIRAG